MALTPRPYQVEAAGNGVEFLLSKYKGNGVLYEPTGAGKSLMIALMALELADHPKGGPVIVLQPSKEILEQNADKFREYGYEPAIFSASVDSQAANPRTRVKREIGEITLATIGTVWDHPELFEDFKFAIPDECHLINASKGRYLEFRKALPRMRWLGVTASPWRMASNKNGTELRFITRSVPRLFNKVVHYTQISHLVENNWWAKLDYKIVKGFDRTKIKLNSKGSDYDPESLQLHLFESGFQARILEVVQRAFAAGRRNAIVFTPSVDDAEFIAKEMGPTFAAVSERTPPKKRTEIVKRFKGGDIKGVANVGVFVHGLDYPQLECVIDAQPSLSLSRVYQKHGRGVRVHPDKEDCWIVDMVGSHALFGRIDDLTLYCEGKDKWFVAGRPGGRDQSQKKLTNVYLQGDAGKARCKKCGSTDIFFMRHEVTGAQATLSRPKDGQRARIVLRKVPDPKKPEGLITVYAYPKPGDKDAHLVEFVSHWAVCKEQRSL
jgi:DNA repair protein RadD